MGIKGVSEKDTPFFIFVIDLSTIFICMVKKKKANTTNENEVYILPSFMDDMKTFIAKFKVDMMEHVVSSIKFAVEHKLPIVEVFQFKNSPFVITITEKEYGVNLEHINKFYKDNQIYELCPKVELLQEILKHKTNEKEKPDKSNPDNSKH